ncbi:MAG: hypothetical protein U5J64_02440 [Halobacteriales archaeon]|nr:hypothetical protein [Halobacteriales archaeon]
MKRRKFLIGAGAVSLGGTVIVGSGSLSQTDSQRRIKVEIAADSDAYLSVEQHPESDWSDDTVSPAVFDVGENGDGHIEITVDAVRNGTTTRFDNVFRVCNAGKQCVCVWIDGKVGTSPGRVTFYDTETGETVENGENALELGVGECLDIGIEIDAEGLEGRNHLLEGITVNAEAGCPCSDDGNGNPDGASETAWGDGEEFPGGNWFTYFEYNGGDYTTDLVSGRDKLKVGEVSVTEVNGSIEVKYTTDTGWKITETHLAVADEEPVVANGNEWYDNGWLNPGGNPPPGQFPYGDDFGGSGVDEATYTVDVSGLTYPVYVGAHAVVQETGGN